MRIQVVCTAVVLMSCSSADSQRQDEDFIDPTPTLVESPTPWLTPEPETPTLPSEVSPTPDSTSPPAPDPTPDSSPTPTPAPTPEPTPDPYDLDGDGWRTDVWNSESDCNDTSPDIHPGANEICYDNVDQDCFTAYNGWTYFMDPLDNDGDGFLACVLWEDAQEGAISDCDDYNWGRYPGAFEYTSDEVDSDCDGWISQ